MENITSIYNNYYNKVKTDILTKVKNVEIAEDLAADVFIKIHEKLSTFDKTKATLGTWITSITKNLVIDFYRKRKLDSKQMSDLSDDEGKEIVVYTDEWNPEKEFANNHLGNTLLEAIGSLPETQMTVIDLFMLSDLSYEEIGKRLTMPIGTVKATIHRARMTLREKLVNL